MLICMYCDTMSDFPLGYCEDCQEYDGIITPYLSDPFGAFGSDWHDYEAFQES